MRKLLLNLGVILLGIILFCSILGFSIVYIVHGVSFKKESVSEPPHIQFTTRQIATWELNFSLTESEKLELQRKLEESRNPVAADVKVTWNGSEVRLYSFDEFYEPQANSAIPPFMVGVSRLCRI